MDGKFRRKMAKKSGKTSKKTHQLKQPKHVLAPEIEIDTHETLVSIFEPVKIKSIVA